MQLSSSSRLLVAEIHLPRLARQSKLRLKLLKLAWFTVLYVFIHTFVSSQTKTVSFWRKDFYYVRTVWSNAQLVIPSYWSCYHNSNNCFALSWERDLDYSSCSSVSSSPACWPLSEPHKGLNPVKDTVFSFCLHHYLPSREHKERQRGKGGQNLFHTVQIPLEMLLDK